MMRNGRAVRHGRSKAFIHGRALVAASALAVISSSASAALNVYESFNYSTGQLQGNTNAGGGTANGLSWLQAGVANPPSGINVTSGSLTGPAELPPSLGNGLTITQPPGGENSATNRLALGQNYTTGFIYYSFLLNVSDLTNVNNTTGAFFLSMNNTGNSSQTGNPTVNPGKVQLRVDPLNASNYNLGVFGQAAATSGSTAWATNSLSTGTTQFIVASMNPSTKVFNLWINPLASSFGLGTAPTATSTLTDTTTWSGNNIQSLLLRQNTVLAALTLDELRVGSSWADVTPTLSAYWDLNGTTAGAGGATPTGTWDGATANWSTSSSGDAATQAWLGATYKAVFAAGTDATGAYTVTVSGTQNATALGFEEGQVTLTGGTINVSTGVVDTTTATATATLSSNITGTSGLIKNGAGTVILPGTPAYTGATSITAGTLEVGTGGTGGALPTSSAITNNGTLVFNRSDTVTQGTDFSGSGMSGTGNLTQAGTGNLILNAPNTFSGIAKANAGTLTATDSLALQNATVDTSGAGAIVFDNALTSATVGGLSGSTNYSANSGLSITISGNIRNATFGGVVSGSGSLTKSGTICQELSGVNTYSGGTNVNGGILQFGATNSMPASGAVAVNSGGVLAVHVGGAGEWAASGTGVGTVNGLIAGDGGQTATQVTFNDGSSLGINTQPVGSGTGGDITFSGNIGSFNGVSDLTKSVGFMKRGYGTLTVTGSNSFRGQLQVANEGGTLRLTTTVPNAGQSMTTPTVYIGNAQGTDSTILKILTNNALPSNSLINFGSSTTGAGNPKTRLRLHDEDPVTGSLPSASYNQTVRGFSGASGIVDVGGGTLTINVPTSESYASSATYITQADGTWNAGGFDGNGDRTGSRGVIIKTGAGQQDMNQFDSNFEGEFIVQQGTLGIGNDQAFGGVGAGSTRSQLTVNGGTLKNNLSGGLNVRVPLVQMGGNFTLETSGANNFQFLGATNGAFHYLRADPTITVTNSTAGTGVVIFLGQVDDGSFLSLATTHGFTKAGTGVLTLGSNLNSYRGDTVIQEGALRMSTSVVANSQVVSSLGDQANPGRLVMAGGRLELNGQIGSVWNAGITPGIYNATRSNIVNNPLHVEAANNNSSIAYTSTTANLTDDINFVFTSNSVDWTSGTLTFIHNATSQGAAFKPTFTGTGFNYAGPIVISNGGGTRKTVLVSANTSGTQTWSGNISGDGGYTRSGGGTTVLSGANTYAGPTTVSGGELIITQSFRSSSLLNVADGAKATVTPRSGVPDLASSRKTLEVGALSLNTSGTLDLADNDLVVNVGAYTTIQAAVLAGFMTSGPGIITSTSDGSQILAVFDNALVGATDWNGDAIAANAVVGKYTYFGDANIDGQVTGDDYTVIDANLNTTPAVGLEWLSGDMNLDGTITGDDYTVIDANLGLGSGNPLTPSQLSAVPEPGALTVVIGGAMMLMRRRRRV